MVESRNTSDGHGYCIHGSGFVLFISKYKSKITNVIRYEFLIYESNPIRFRVLITQI